ncbi:glycosyltransferase [Streptomyces cinnabarinus]|uniref:Glycosyltransferase n=1 Tax=Streptomyces cinnabarinus TaxID=67287 RepID=A0ABY7KTH7_9ACTN|nr:cellulose synthase catalytic subunit [Streptomyces cinnabarinus]WAZ27338.1 glycosyltransferase [Streptomyces cinnabarinus]
MFRPPLRPLPRYDYEHYSRLAGPLTQPSAGIPYRVRHRSLLSAEPHRVRTALALALVPLISLCTLLWLLQPSHWQHQPTLWIVMLGCVGAIEGARLTSVLSCAHATLFAQDPIPVVPETGTRVAFLTTFVPGKEPLEMLSNTLRAAVRIRHRGLMHVWVLDEGNDPEVRALCDQLGVHHFSRKGVAKWNTTRGVHRAKTKHGNYNAWLDAQGRDYDFIAAVDTDHVPFPNFLERTLGYFRDPDTAFVVSPQVYGNYDSVVTKMAESQQFMFHALIQRVGNRHGSPMLVGTNLAVRTTALLQVGGFQDSITEDMLTGLAIHQRRHPVTGRHWRSVYTPDVLAVGEGPSAWTDFVTQQLRWSRGTYETLLKDFWKAPFKLRLPSLVNYFFLLSWYPLLAISWILGGVSLALYFVGGASGGDIDPVVWAVLYGNAVALQVALYIWNRRHNVSPHEPVGSSGLAGMAMTLIIAPVYTRSFTDALLRRKSRFFVTPKGSSASPDRFFGTFRIHLFWAVTVTGLAAYGIAAHHTHPAMLVWATLTVAASLTPVVLWQREMRKQRREWGFRRDALANPPS